MFLHLIWFCLSFLSLSSLCAEKERKTTFRFHLNIPSLENLDKQKELASSKHCRTTSVYRGLKVVPLHLSTSFILNYICPNTQLSNLASLLQDAKVQWTTRIGTKVYSKLPECKKKKKTGGGAKTGKLQHSQNYKKRLFSDNRG